MKPEVQAYFDAVPAERRERIDHIHTLILSLYPNADIKLSYKIPTYKVGDGWVALANQKHYVSVYTCGAHHIAEFKTRHPKIKTGTGCINFKDKDQIPDTDLAAVIKHAIEHPKPE